MDDERLRPLRVVVEALAADFGGIRTYVENLLQTWQQTYPQDRLLVVRRPGSDLDTGDHARRELRVPAPATVGRPLAQTARTNAIVRDFRADVLLATLPSTTLIHPSIPVAVVVHDLRHELRPDQFSRGRRVLRRLSYGRAYAVATGFIAVSQNTLDDLHRLHPSIRGKPSVVVHHGGDHVGSWPAATRLGPAVAFAHHTNKNPDLVVEGWAEAQRLGVGLPPLLVLGVSPHLRGSLARLIDQHELDGQVTLAPYLSEEDFRRTMAEAAVVVLPSDLEGFGLPVIEGMALGKPVVIGPDPGAVEVAGGHATVMEGWTAAALAEAVERAAASPPEAIEAARTWAQTFTWERAVRETRSALGELLAPGGLD